MITFIKCFLCAGTGLSSSYLLTHLINNYIDRLKHAHDVSMQTYIPDHLSSLKYYTAIFSRGLPLWFRGKESACNAGTSGDAGSILGSGRSLEKKGKPIPLFLPGKSYGQRSLVGYSLWGYKSVRHNLVTKQEQQQHIPQGQEVKSSQLEHFLGEGSGGVFFCF